MSRGIFEGIPLLWVLVGSALAFLAAAQAGYLVGRWIRARTGQGPGSDLSTTLGGLLGLLGLILGFTFAMAGGRFDRRRDLVVEEANAIGTAWLRTDLVPEPARGQARETLRAYVQSRLDAAAAGTRERVLAEVTRGEQLQARLWGTAVAASAAAPTPVAALYVASVNEVIDMHGRRVAASLRNPVPTVIFATLYAVGVLVLAAVGYSRGLNEDRSAIATTVLSVVLAVVLALILDLDRPGEGFMRINKDALEDVRAQMR